MGDSVEQKNVREILLDTACRILRLQHGTPISIDDVCHVAKIRKSSFYCYFSSLNDLLLTGYKRTGQNNQNASSGAVHDNKPGDEL